MCAMISGLFIGSNDGRPPQAYKENIVSLKTFSLDCVILIDEYHIHLTLTVAKLQKMDQNIENRLK